MEYPKPVMRKKELERMGFGDAYLMRAFRTRGQRFAWKTNPLNAKNSPILFDTALFEQWRVEDITAQEKSRRREEWKIKKGGGIYEGVSAN